MAIETALVVDDSRSARYILQRLLERQHIHVEGVDSAEEALAYLREVRPDVVFMDDMMPGMAGDEAIGHLAANPATANIPIVMYTGRDYASDAPLPQRHGVVGVLNKPFTQQDVNALLAKLGGVIAPAPVTMRLVRNPTHVPTHPQPVPATVSEAVSPAISDDLSRYVAAAVATEMNALRAQMAAQVKAESRLAVEQVIGERLEQQVHTQIEQHETGWRRTLDGMRNEQSKFQQQLLEQRVPRLLGILEKRLERRADALQKSASERIENANLGPLQRTQVTQIARSAAVDAAQRPARESARRVAAELMQTDIKVLGLRLDRLRRRLSVVVTSAVIAVVAALAVGYALATMV